MRNLSKISSKNRILLKTNLFGKGTYPNINHVLQLLAEAGQENIPCFEIELQNQSSMISSKRTLAIVSDITAIDGVAFREIINSLGDYEDGGTDEEIQAIFKKISMVLSAWIDVGNYYSNAQLMTIFYFQIFNSNYGERDSKRLTREVLTFLDSELNIEKNEKVREAIENSINELQNFI